MKTRVTKREIMQDGKRVLRFGYCEAQRLLNIVQPRFYTTGTYGWNADVYEFRDCYIVTGYRPFGENPDHDLIKAYDQKSEGKTYEEKLDILSEMIEELTR